MLAKLFVMSSNVLVLDEPTNDLDAETLELLGDRLLNYKGTILLISHAPTTAWKPWKRLWTKHIFGGMNWKLWLPNSELGRDGILGGCYSTSRSLSLSIEPLPC